MNLLSKLGIEHSVLRDKDPGKQLQTEVNRLIDQAMTSFTVAIEEIDPDLEGYLGLPNPGRPDRKPQNALYSYATNKINDAKLTDFCTIVDRLLS